jgi:hypothetical protein
VYGTELTVVLDGSEVVGTLGRLLPSTGAATTPPHMTPAQAAALAARLEPQGGAPVGDVELVLFDAAQFRHGARQSMGPRHAYRVSLERVTLLLDAETGAVLSLVPHQTEAFDLRVLRLIETDALWWCEALDESSCVASPTKVLCHACCSQDEQLNIRQYFLATWQYYYTQHLWDSFGNAGQQIVAFTNSNQTTNALSWWSIVDGNQFHFVDSYRPRRRRAQFTHAVIGSTSGLAYAFESGALNESLADLFGNLVEGEIDLVGNNAPVGTIRSMCDPPA